jgi:hypothetical protein
MMRADTGRTCNNKMMFFAILNKKHPAKNRVIDDDDDFHHDNPFEHDGTLGMFVIYDTSMKRLIS